MSVMRDWLRGMLALGASTLFAACAQQGGTTLPTTSLASERAAFPDLTPPKCKGQIDAKQYASLTVTLSTQGGSFCVPEFGGFGGSVQYPSADPSVKLKLISSTKDYNGEPQLGPGKAIFYLQVALSGGTFFGTTVKAGGGLTAAKLVPGKPYTAFGEATAGSFTLHMTPCYAIAKKGKYGGVIGGLGALLKGYSVPEAATGVLEIYSGKQTTGKC